MNWEKALPRYAAYLATHQEPLTVETYLGVVKAFFENQESKGLPTIMDTQLIGDFVVELQGNGFSDNTLRKYYFGLKNFFAWAKAYTKWQIGIDWNLVPCPRVPWIESKALSRDELQRFFDCCTNHTTYTISLVLYDLALRVSDLQALRVKDIDWETGEVNLAPKKRGRPLTTHLAKETLEALASYKERFGKKDKLFNVSRSKVNRRLRKVAIASGVITTDEKFGSHRFRHSRLTHFDEDDWKVGEIAAFARHKSIQSTMRYIKVREGDIDARKKGTDRIIEEL